MTLWVDGDGCPARIRGIVERAARRVGAGAVFVSSKPLAVVSDPRVRFVQVPAGEGAADAYIREHAQPGDLAVTADIPLAAELVAAGVDVLHPRGDLYTRETIGERLAMRQLLGALRAAGLETTGRRLRGGPHRFASALDRELARRLGPPPREPPLASERGQQ